MCFLLFYTTTAMRAGINNNIGKMFIYFASKGVCWLAGRVEIQEAREKERDKLQVKYEVRVPST